MNKFEYAATLAASLAYLLLAQQDAVGLILFDDNIQAEIEAHSHRAHLKPLIARIDHARLTKPSDNPVLFGRLAGRLVRRSIVVVISDLLSDPGEIISGLERFRHERHEVVVMHVLDQDEREFPFVDRTQFEGLEVPTQQALVDPSLLRQGYLAALDRFISKIRAACTNTRIDYVGLSTGDPLDMALREYLTARSHRIKSRA